MPERLIVVDDEPSMREFLEIMLSQDGYEVRTAASGEEGLKLYKSEEPDLILTDVKMPGMSGLDLIKHIHSQDPAMPVIAVTAYASADDALRAVREGAYDYLSKPFQIEDLRIIIRNALEARRLRIENQELKKSIQGFDNFSHMVGISPQMQEIFQFIEKVAPSKASVLIIGESGTGKELIAKAIHKNSPRCDKPFVAINCTAIPENLLESEMFGHQRGSFTGALTNKPGLVELAHTGTLFLDEVGEIPISIQAKLLRFLQEHEFRRVGGTDEKKIDVRIIAATNKKLEYEMEKGNFREDLYYRLNVIRIRVPPLREREKDIPLLINHFLRKFCTEQGKDITKVSSLALRVLCNYQYPGNVRELENIIERCVTLEQSDQLTAQHLPPKLTQSEGVPCEIAELDIPSDGIELDRTLENLERKLINRALEITGGNRSRAARLLGISFRSLRYRLVKLGMESEEMVQ
ncbi:sigma-54-dependent transcriptional regulator [Desulfomonile tiedjei]|uniref:Response regulator with CheY-like receiver, AAA-type ATPase, and DNA-binding domains n=1 Tax=Desulfomonile tiedjei (strain ATCC 49306 / DSM 6799 / DCB-1) TaxID=706587 RepID=I4C0J7_DESTA|nr:sigma-54 dependent transcriptional regulator [Desulfomonile tiedjei]AFM23088.1 response regulator with CheY-like receiver, AAA-type ATPase, and DNA-binding domains [Desulfomonile tiedjei DSM 6799]